MDVPSGEGPSRAAVAAFDLDGTLTSGHSLHRFVLDVAGPIRSGCALGRGALPALRARSRRELKARVLEHVLRGRRASDVRSVGERLAEDLVANELRPDVVAKLEAHRAAGHQLVMVTAALDAYAVPIGERLGFDAVLSAVVEVIDGRCSGRIVDADLTGDAKVRALTSWLGDQWAERVVYAYGNSADDEQLIEFAQASRQPGNGQRPVPPNGTGPVDVLGS